MCVCIHSVNMAVNTHHTHPRNAPYRTACRAAAVTSTNVLFGARLMHATTCGGERRAAMSTTQPAARRWWEFEYHMLIIADVTQNSRRFRATRPVHDGTVRCAYHTRIYCVCARAHECVVSGRACVRARARLSSVHASRTDVCVCERSRK